MLMSFALILTAGWFAGRLSEKIRLPSLMGMLVTGILIGPYCLNLIDSSVLNISSELRRIALIIILIRAGLNLKVEDLKKNGRPAILMCFVPATLEIIGTFFLAPLILGLSRMESLLLGTVLAAVSPAVIVPHMLKIMDEKYGTEKGIPQMILAGASADDVYVIVLFTSVTKMMGEGSFDITDLLRIPTSLIFGILGGILAGFALSRILRFLKTDDTVRLILFLCVSFILSELENRFTGRIGFSGLIAIMAMGMSYAADSPKTAVLLSAGFSRLWSAAMIFLFVLVGAAVDITYAMQAGFSAVLLIFGVLVFRMAGVWLCVWGTRLSLRERIFCMIAYCPKATVQAAIGAIPLTMGFTCGKSVLTAAVVSILITAPLGALLIDSTYRKLLSDDRNAVRQTD